MVYFLPNHCHLLDFWRQKNVQLYWTDGRTQNPNLLVNLLGICGSSIYGLSLFILFHQVHSYYIWQGLCLSSMGRNAWIYDQPFIDGKQHNNTWFDEFFPIAVNKQKSKQNDLFITFLKDILKYFWADLTLVANDYFLLGLGDCGRLWTMVIYVGIDLLLNRWTIQKMLL